ncbi:hypothetical protein [Flavimarina sp. Hel_I_48]|uniref:hypothetical protein n=1 Tax=Flavimarina sp. Hel_I_48 TaxID=1392488 RepID=UPI0004DF4F7C|nr:hypothetical protein [Flavimarina sp. Hel_I_48]
MRLWAVLLLFSPVLAQNKPEHAVFLFDVQGEERHVSFENGRNISRNDGYNNQPSFYDDKTLLYSRNRKDQTDIGIYDITQDSTSFLNKSLGGSEFSPLRIPGSQEVAAVRLDEDGTQRLYSYSQKDSTNLLSAVKVGYFDFYSAEKILAAVVNPSGMNLHFINLKTQKDSLIITNVGRGVRKVPNSTFMSYTLVNETGELDIYLLDIDEGMTSYFVCTLPIGIQDYAWLDSAQILIGSRNQLFIYDTLGEPKWEKTATLETDGLEQITRLAVSPNGRKLAVVAHVPKP